MISCYNWYDHCTIAPIHGAKQWRPMNRGQKPRAKMEQDIQYTRVKQGRIYEAVVDQLQNLIVSEKLQPGDKLLPERELAQRFGVSRTAVRDAIRVLSERGLVDVRPGAGTFVIQEISDTVAESMGLLFQIEKSSHKALHEVREILEVEMAGLAAERATESDVEKIEKAFEKMQSNVNDPARFIEADLVFHLAIAEATHNRIFLLLLNPIIDLLQKSRRMIVVVPEGPARAMEHHRQVTESIRRKAKVQARQAMSQHMQQIAEDIKTALSQSLPDQPDRQIRREQSGDPAGTEPNKSA
jgi:GntR family transcriptional repressor for pyruvate dehydrogenase complex